MIRGDAMVGVEQIGRLKESIRKLGELPMKLAAEAKPEIDRLLREQFDQGRDPYGRAWAPLRPSTLAKGRQPPPLTDTRALRDATRVRTAPGRRGLLLVTGPHGYFHQVGFRVYRTQVQPRRILPQYGLPATWKRAIDAAARRIARRAMGR